MQYTWRRCVHLGIFGRNLKTSSPPIRREHFCRECRYIHRLAHYYAYQLAVFVRKRTDIRSA